ncbi:transglycosylase family protein [Sanguibacter sp. 25GB23B1]|uniref:transglycosylase family protein n=1 Tax=unclassified Sanguibacter TaxID=2645534 RepID=UPI0032B01220
MKNPFRDSASHRSPSPTDSTDAGLTTAPLHSSEATSLENTSSRPARRKGRRTALIVGGGLVLALAGGGTAVYADAHKTVTLDVDGTVTTVSTFSGSVAGVLAEQGITVGDDDLVAPSSNAELSEDADVVVRYARVITLEQDGVATEITTTAVDADELLEAYASRGGDVRLVASRSEAEGRTDVGLRLSIDGPVDLLVDGVTTSIPDGSVGLDTIFTDTGVVLGELDRVSVQHLPTPEALQAQERAAELAAQQAVDAAAQAAVPADPAAPVDPAVPAAPAADATAEAPSDVIADPRVDDTQLTIVVNRVAVADQAVTAAIPFETVTEEDATRFEDLDVATKVEGVEGVQTTVFSVTTVDGVEESRVLVSDAVTTAPVTKVLVQGTKERPKVVAPKVTAPAATAPAGAEPAPAAVVTGDVWSRLAQCESGGNPSIVSSNGLYHGLYQFSVGTWQSVGGSGLPSQASAAEQTRLAQVLQARSGWGQWPHCSSKLGLR